jgi:hypothetical protein
MTTGRINQVATPRPRNPRRIASPAPLPHPPDGAAGGEASELMRGNAFRTATTECAFALAFPNAHRLFSSTSPERRRHALDAPSCPSCRLRVAPHHRRASHGGGEGRPTVSCPANLRLPSNKPQATHGATPSTICPTGHGRSRVRARIPSTCRAPHNSRAGKSIEGHPGRAPRDQPR